VWERDHEKPPPVTVPYHRPQTAAKFSKYQVYQYDIWHSFFYAQSSAGDPTPSHADIQMTQQIISVAQPLGISVHDHIIVGKEGHASLKGLKLI